MSETLTLSKRVEEALKLTEEMTAIELSNYAKAMREKFGITATPMAAAAGPAGGGAAAAPVEEQDSFGPTRRSFTFSGAA